MTIRECYEELGLDFDAVLSRLINERLGTEICTEISG